MNKLILISFLLSSQTVLGSENFKDRLSIYLENKYEKFVQKASLKLDVSKDYLEKNFKKETLDESIKFIGFPETKYGLCKINGEATFLEVKSSVKCIDKALNGKIIFI
tara:strand:+ start:201 stop:524 length:324 start_codon:yes stop_codon:yes gene_type:complete